MAASFRWDDFVLDMDAYRLDKTGVAVPLEPKAFDLLTLMVQRPGHLFLTPSGLTPPSPITR